MRIENEQGDLLWAPNNFGSYSVEKTQEIADIISDVLGDLTINVNSQSEKDLSDFYDKEEINTLLRDYLLRADYSDTAGPAIRAATDAYLESLRNTGGIVDSDVTQKLVYAADFWTKCCLNMTYNELINAQVAPTATSFASRLDNLEGIQNSHTTYLNRIIQNMYEDTETRTGLLLSTRAFTGEGAGVTIGTGSNTYSSLVAAVNDLLANSQQSAVNNLSNIVNSLSQQMGNLDTRINGLNYVSQSDVVTSSTNSNDKVPSAALEYQDRQSIESLTTTVNGISFTVSGLGTRVDGLDTTTDGLDTRVGSLNSLSNDISDRSSLVAAINSLQSVISGLNSQISGLSNRIDDLSDRVTALENANNG